MIASCHPADQQCIDAFKAFGGKAVIDNKKVVETTDIVFLSVKPQIVPIALNDVKSISSGKLFISIAMGVTLADIESVRFYRKFYSQ